MKDWIIGIGLTIVTLLTPIHAIMITVGFLIFADLVLGIMAANKRGEKITSAVMRRTLSKILVYQLVVVSGFVAETYLLGGVMPISKLAAGAIGLVEVTSLVENANSILGYNVFKQLLSKLGSENDKPESDKKGN